MIRSGVLVDCLLYAATTPVASRLDIYDVKIRVMISDEAAQAGESDAVAALPADLEFLVMSGDVQQLGPVVLSHQAERNSLSNILTKSLMGRVLASYPEIQRVQLNVNYRSHPSIVALGSKLFYADKMTSGRDTRNCPPSREDGRNQDERSPDERD